MVTNKLEKPKQRSKVAIVGFAPSWNEAPFDDEEFEIWGINELYLQAKDKRFTAWFEIHDPKSPSKNVETHQKWLQNTKLPLYMQKHFDEFPSSIKYPRQEVKDMVNENFIHEGKGSYYTDFSNQITWMTLFAIYKGYKEIHIYGVDMAQQSEYAWQRSSCQFAIGFAMGRGIKVLIPKTSELCKYPMDYGFETDNKNRHLSKIRVKSLKESLMGYNAQILDIEFQYQDKHKKFELLKNQLNQQIQQIEDELIRLDIHINKNTEVINFLKDMPLDPQVLKTKKEEVSNNIVEQNNIMEKAKPDLEKQRKALFQRLENESKLDFMNLRTMEITKERLNSTINATNGAIGEVNYNLSNNRV